MGRGLRLPHPWTFSGLETQRTGLLTSGRPVWTFELYYKITGEFTHKTEQSGLNESRSPNPIAPDALPVQVANWARCCRFLTRRIGSGRMVAHSETIPAPCGSSSDLGGHLAVKSPSRTSAEDLQRPRWRTGSPETSFPDNERLVPTTGPGTCTSTGQLQDPKEGLCIED